MAGIQHIFFLDISVMFILYVLANLSKRFGEAMKKPPFYKLFHLSLGLILVSFLINTVTANATASTIHLSSQVVSMGLRCVAGILSVFSSLQYWKWLFAEISR